MLDAFIIEELRRREEREREQTRERPTLELPIDDRSHPRPSRRDTDDSGDSDRGVIVIDI